MLRITLKKMLFLVGVAAALLAVATQIGMGTAEFEIVGNELELDDDQLVSGTLWGNFVGHDLPEPNEVTFVFEIRNVKQTSIVNMQPGHKKEIRYRVTEYWPLKRQDPFEFYLNRHFGVSKAQTKGFAWGRGHVTVGIDGTE